MRPPLLGAAIAAMVLALGCGSTSSSSSSSSSTTTRGAPTAAQLVNSPSESAKMVCAAEAQEDIAQGLGAPTTQVTPPTWVDAVYSCRYQYADGAFTLSVKELTDPPATGAYFTALARTLGRRAGTLTLGDDAFVTTNGSVVVRKDLKVLTVDIAGMPPRFGQPPESPDQVAVAVASRIMDCWTGY